jgi:predicted enzyme related to lactoylglutathione lyase
MMKPNPVGWFEIYVQDMERAKQFYEAVFQTELTKLENPNVELWGFPMEMNQMGAAGALVKIEGCSSGGNSVLVYFSCVDCAVEEARIVPNGGVIHRSKFSIGEYGFIALAVDTEGNMFGLHSMV